MESLKIIVDRYKVQDTWKENVVFNEDSFNLLEDILEEAGELKDHVPYDKLVNTKLAEEVMQERNKE